MGRPPRWACRYSRRTFLRLPELARETGYLPFLWDHLLQSFFLGVAEEDPKRKHLITDEATKMLRVFVDIGDVAREAQSRFCSA
jgi:hypothetical protein